MHDWANYPSGLCDVPKIGQLASNCSVAKACPLPYHPAKPTSRYVSSF